MIASGLLNLRPCRALGYYWDGKSQVGITPICVSAEWCIMPCCTIVARLLVLGMHPVHLVELLSESFVQQRCAYP
jgi:hypothetical protein